MPGPAKLDVWLALLPVVESFNDIVQVPDEFFATVARIVSPAWMVSVLNRVSGATSLGVITSHQARYCALPLTTSASVPVWIRYWSLDVAPSIPTHVEE